MSESDNTSLNGKVALVTGAGRGIGAAVVRALYAAGARVALVARTESDLATLVDELNADDARVAVLPADIADENAVSATFDRAERQLGPLDILVNNAGIPTRRPFEVADYPTEDFDRITGVNLRGAFLCARAALQRMRERRSGTIVNIGSISGIRAAPDVLPYSISKFGMEALSQTILAESTRYGIKTHLVSPGDQFLDLGPQGSPTAGGCARPHARAGGCRGCRHVSVAAAAACADRPDRRDAQRVPDEAVGLSVIGFVIIASWYFVVIETRELEFVRETRDG